LVAGGERELLSGRDRRLFLKAAISGQLNAPSDGSLARIRRRHESFSGP